MSLIDQAQAAYEKVAGFPEARGDKGWTDLLTLRNMVPDLIDALRQSTTEYTACIATVSQLENGSAVETSAPLFPEGVFQWKDGNYYRLERVQAPQSSVKTPTDGGLCSHNLPIDADCEHCDGPAF